MNHIKREDNQEPDRAWCGSLLDNSFYFKDIDQVIINNFHGERIPCLQCIHGVIIALTEQPPKANQALLTGTAQDDILVV